MAVELLEYTPRRVRGMGFRELQTGEKGPATKTISRPAQTPTNRNRSAFEDRRGPQFCAAAGFDGGPENQKVGAAIEA
jgi:hypothetical protein